MPELPEVEVTRQKLLNCWEGRAVVSVWAAAPNYFFLTAPSVLKKRLLGRKTQRLVRHGKYLLAELDDESRLLCHLGMTGQIAARKLPQDGHLHLVLSLTGGKTVSFRDVRKFGKVEWLAPGESSPRLDKLGPDALRVTEVELRAGLLRRQLPVKAALLDQGLLAGVGNIYADEALFAAKLLPTRPAKDLTPREVRRLLASLHGILADAISRGGSTISDYVQPDGVHGNYQALHRVYARAGAPCVNCQRPIARIVLGGRSTHYCPGCQR